MRDRWRGAEREDLEGWQQLTAELHRQLGDEPDDTDERRAAECWPAEDVDTFKLEHGRAPHRE